MGSPDLGPAGEKGQKEKGERRQGAAGGGRSSPAAPGAEAEPRAGRASSEPGGAAHRGAAAGHGDMTCCGAPRGQKGAGRDPQAAKNEQQSAGSPHRQAPRARIPSLPSPAAQPLRWRPGRCWAPRGRTGRAFKRRPAGSGPRPGPWSLLRGPGGQRPAAGGAPWPGGCPEPGSCRGGRSSRSSAGSSGSAPAAGRCRRARG